MKSLPVLRKKPAKRPVRWKNVEQLIEILRKIATKHRIPIQDSALIKLAWAPPVYSAFKAAATNASEKTLLKWLKAEYARMVVRDSASRYVLAREMLHKYMERETENQRCTP